MIRVFVFAEYSKKQDLKSVNEINFWKLFCKFNSYKYKPNPEMETQKTETIPKMNHFSPSLI